MSVNGRAMERLGRATCGWLVLAAVPLSIAGAFARAEDPKDKETARKELRTKFIKEQFAAWTFTSEGEEGRTTRSEALSAAGAELSLRYTNPVGNLVEDGATCLFRRNGVPVAAWSLSIRGPQKPPAVWVEMTSLVPESARCDKEGDLRWAPAAGGHLQKTLTGADVPADKPVRRLVQMRDIARRFTVELYKGDDPNPTLLRLMPQPMDRYQHEAGKIVDGALFAFVEANDPEFLLAVEARTTEGAGARAALEWRYSLARMTSRRVRVLKEGQTEYEVHNYWQQPRAPTDRYIEFRDGVFEDQ